MCRLVVQQGVIDFVGVRHADYDPFAEIRSKGFCRLVQEQLVLVCETVEQHAK